MQEEKTGTDLKQVKQFIRQKWSELTDEDLDSVGENIEGLASKIQEKYGYSKERAAEELQDFKNMLH